MSLGPFSQAASPLPADRPIGRDFLRGGAGAVVLMLIMFIGSIGMWVGTPLLWMWIGGQVQGATNSLGDSLGVMFFGSLAMLVLDAALLARLSDFYRSLATARGRPDPGHVALEGVLVISAGCTLAAFMIWFFLIAGADPIPLGMTL